MKNTNKKSKKKIEANFKIEKRVFKKIIKNNFNVCAHYIQPHILSGIKFEYKDGILKLVSTDGNRLLVNEIQCVDGVGECEAVYNGNMLGQIKFIKNICVGFDGYIDYLQFTMTPDELKIWDIANDIVYTAKRISDEIPYPDYKQLFPNISKSENNEYTQIGLNVDFVRELERMAVNPRTKICTLTFKNNSPLSVVMAESDDPSINAKSKTIIMPIRIRN